MPPIKDAIITRDFLLGLRQGLYWIPKDSEIKLGSCVDPPRKELIADELVKVMLRFKSLQGPVFEGQLKATSELIRSKPPNATWMLNVLFTFDENHAFFAKAWLKPKKVKANAAGAPSLLKNDDGFFTGLPEYKGKSTKSKVDLSKQAAGYLSPEEKLLQKQAKINQQL